jgi:hypothetical protein
MLLDEWDLDTALKVEREEGIEIGVEIGVEVGENRVLELLERGLSTTEIKAQLARQPIDA